MKTFKTFLDITNESEDTIDAVRERKKKIFFGSGSHEELMNTIKNDKDWDVRRVALNHPNAKPEHIAAGLEHEDEQTRHDAVHALNHKFSYGKNAFEQKHVDKLLHKALSDESDGVRLQAAMSFSLNDKHRAKMLKDSNEVVRHSAITRRNINTGLTAPVSILKKALKDPVSYNAETAMRYLKQANKE